MALREQAGDEGAVAQPGQPHPTPLDPGGGDARVLTAPTQALPVSEAAACGPEATAEKAEKAKKDRAPEPHDDPGPCVPP